MNKDELYQECIMLTPYFEQNIDDYRYNLSHALKTYQSFLQKLEIKRL